MFGEHPFCGPAPPGSSRRTMHPHSQYLAGPPGSPLPPLCGQPPAKGCRVLRESKHPIGEHLLSAGGPLTTAFFDPVLWCDGHLVGGCRLGGHLTNPTAGILSLDRKGVTFPLPPGKILLMCRPFGHAVRAQRYENHAAILKQATVDRFGCLRTPSEGSWMIPELEPCGTTVRAPRRVIDWG